MAAKEGMVCTVCEKPTRRALIYVQIDPNNDMVLCPECALTGAEFLREQEKATPPSSQQRFLCVIATWLEVFKKSFEAGISAAEARFPGAMGIKLNDDSPAGT
jgi:hypothetical protein